eukprot:NODE_137_length_18042_cov_0.768823.p11 type:complete len:125 gc:universal NODE_137_length_18042_cov_0.768823:10761-11135(+)
MSQFRERYHYPVSIGCRVPVIALIIILCRCKLIAVIMNHFQQPGRCWRSCWTICSRSATISLQGQIECQLVYNLVPLFCLVIQNMHVFTHTVYIIHFTVLVHKLQIHKRGCAFYPSLVNQIIEF